MTRCVHKNNFSFYFVSLPHSVPSDGGKNEEKHKMTQPPLERFLFTRLCSVSSPMVAFSWTKSVRLFNILRPGRTSWCVACETTSFYETKQPHTHNVTVVEVPLPDQPNKFISIDTLIYPQTHTYMTFPYVRPRKSATTARSP